jgi:hypothetical protein
MTAGSTSTLIRGARVFDGEQLRPASNVLLAGRTIADLLLVDGDPCADITATRNIAAIWRNGARLHRRPPHTAITTTPTAHTPASPAA